MKEQLSRDAKEDSMVMPSPAKTEICAFESFSVPDKKSNMLKADAESAWDQSGSEASFISSNLAKQEGLSSSEIAELKSILRDLYSGKYISKAETKENCEHYDSKTEDLDEDSLVSLFGEDHSFSFNEESLDIAEQNESAAQTKVLTTANITDVPNSYSCYMYPRKFASLENLLRHLGLPFKENPYQCSMCQIIEISENDFRQHIETHISSHKCPNCERLFSTTELLDKHRPTHREGTGIPCFVCSKQFKTKQILQEHIKIHEEREPLQCLICKSTLVSTNSWMQHMKGHMKTLSLQCPICQKVLSSKSILIDHMNLHTGKKPYSCKHCEESFASGSGRNQHIRAKHKNKPTCEACGKSLSRRNLKGRMTLHYDDSPHRCSICRKGFTRKSGLRRHMEQNCEGWRGLQG